MRTTAFEEYPHETELRLKKEAGPDLYDALAFLIEGLPETPSAVGFYDLGSVSATVVDEARAALAKARGEA